MIPALPATQHIKYVPTSVEIYQYDTSPIGDRQPVLLIHGLNSEYVHMFHWQQVCKYLTESEFFQKHYKIYLARYNTKAPEKETEKAFKPAIQELASTQGHPIIVIALSIAGSIIRNAMTDPTVDQSIAKVITLGAPLHGSPLFSKEWMQYSLLTRHKIPTSRLDRYLSYTLFFKRHKNLLDDYYWDNCDQQYPSIGAYQFRFPILAKGVLLPPTQPPQGANYTQSKEKIIAYAGYLSNQFSSNRKRSKLFAPFYSFSTFFSTTIPAHLLRQHAVLREANYDLASIVRNQKTSGSPYVLNDGIIPVASGLSLPPDAIGRICNYGEKEVARIKSEINIKGARLFQNIDHLTFFEASFSNGKVLTDQLSPTEKPRSMFAWLLNDIEN